MGAGTIFCAQSASYVAVHRNMDLRVVAIGPDQAVDESGEFIELGTDYQQETAPLSLHRAWRRAPKPADSDYLGHAFRSDVGHQFRLMSAGWRAPLDVSCCTSAWVRSSR